MRTKTMDRQFFNQLFRLWKQNKIEQAEMAERLGLSMDQVYEAIRVKLLKLASPSTR